MFGGRQKEAVTKVSVRDVYMYRNSHHTRTHHIPNHQMNVRGYGLLTEYSLPEDNEGPYDEGARASETIQENKCHGLRAVYEARKVSPHAERKRDVDG